ncbi:Dps family protein [Secundilactobacillus similis]|jgi:starvation-inducible DNA-binding protein|uniref:DNA-binding ferritin-like protein (Oxidative damage protectant) n=1 Tax=Secundilactobacillus similis DSM 23365 = JCM 2765 TaxID=1423804 RepID=A0A0R2F028_9LACO|nr:DNA starvation/stationary phase protection protein [Secundilactobacillus similis]KRN21774.1 DNA-binding ferritin-like protein (oxidative damage protectant) [Secundilactobacillus similis DSM 23365 = JCM 2765]
MAQYKKTKAQLNQLIADLSQLQVNIQQIHWYMRGSQFFKLHPLMDDYNDALANQLDEIAERLIAIGGAPLSTTHEFIENTGLPDEKVTWDQYSLKQYMERLDTQFKYLSDQYQKGIEITDEEKDFSTQDLLIECHTLIDKYIWMISAYLGRGAQD